MWQKRFITLTILITTLLALPILADVTNVVVRPVISNALQPSKVFNYTFVFSRNNTCNNILLNNSLLVTTDVLGIGFNTLSLAGLDASPSFICRYRNDTLDAIRNLSTGLFSRGFFSENVTIETNLSGQYLFGTLRTNNTNCDVKFDAKGEAVCGTDATAGTSAEWLTSGSSLYNDSSTVKVGIRTSTPTHALTVVGGEINASAGFLVNISDCGAAQIKGGRLGCNTTILQSASGTGDFVLANNNSATGNNTFSGVTEIFTSIIHNFNRLIQWGNITGVPNFVPNAFNNSGNITGIKVDNATFASNSSTVRCENIQGTTDNVCVDADTLFNNAGYVNTTMLQNSTLIRDNNVSWITSNQNNFNNNNYVNTTMLQNSTLIRDNNVSWITANQAYFSNTGYTNNTNDFVITGKWNFTKEINLSGGIKLNQSCSSGLAGIDSSGRIFCNTTISQSQASSSTFDNTNYTNTTNDFSPIIGSWNFSNKLYFPNRTCLMQTDAHGKQSCNTTILQPPDTDTWNTTEQIRAVLSASNPLIYSSTTGIFAFDWANVVNTSNAQTISGTKTFTAFQNFTTDVYFQNGTCLLQTDANRKLVCNSTVLQGSSSSVDLGEYVNRTMLQNSTLIRDNNVSWITSNQNNFNNNNYVNATMLQNSTLIRDSNTSWVQGIKVDNATFADNTSAVRCENIQGTTDDVCSDADTFNFHWTTNGTTLYNSTANVGIGTGLATQKLEIIGNFSSTNATITNSLLIPSDKKIFLGNTNNVYIMFNSAGGYGELG